MLGRRTAANYCFLFGFFFLAAVLEVAFASELCKIYATSHSVDFAISFITISVLLMEAVFVWQNLRALQYKDIQAQFLSAEKEALMILQSKQLGLGETHIRLVQPLSGLAELYSKYGRYADSQALLERAYEIASKELGIEHPITIGRLLSRAANDREQGLYLQSKQLYDQAIDQLTMNTYVDEDVLAGALLGRAKTLRLLTQNTSAQRDIVASKEIF